MPGHNSKGPQGQGPRTGRGMGKCNSKRRSKDHTNTTEDDSSGMALRDGHGRGKGRRCRSHENDPIQDYDS
ncbi:MAG: DUF5320 domain-containing protein [Maribacter sp.]|uniref:DUF5320 domain-containing protein n=1 Tax=Maribacter sp. TaxID=1897614 RepID=UPI003C7836C1